MKWPFHRDRCQRHIWYLALLAILHKWSGNTNTVNMDRVQTHRLADSHRLSTVLSHGCEVNTKQTVHLFTTRITAPATSPSRQPDDSLLSFIWALLVTWAQSILTFHHPINSNYNTIHHKLSKFSWTALFTKPINSQL